MRALTLKQPWASLIALGVKSIETRGYGTAYRGPLVIHAGKARPVSIYAAGLIADFVADGRWLLKRYDDDDGALTLNAPLPLGAVVAVVDLVDVVPIVEDWPLDTVAYVRREQRTTGVTECWLYNDETGRCSDVTGQEPYGIFTPGRFAWLLNNPRVVDPPIPAKGKLGPWRPDPALRLEVSKAAHLAEVTR